MAEDLADYLKDKGIRVHFLHSDIKTLDRTDILEDLRRGKYDVIVGVNLLREGLDLPEVSLVVILDADKEGFLRSETSLIQTMGRAARHLNGQVIMYADYITTSIKRAIAEVERRRQVQIKYNRTHHLIPKSIDKPIREKLIKREKEEILPFDLSQLTPGEKKELVRKLTLKMRQAAKEFDFEEAAKIKRTIESIN